MRFGSPEYLHLLWALPIFWVLSIVVAKRSVSRISKALGPKMSPFLARNVSKGRRRLKLVLRLVALAVAIVALARPQIGKGLSEIKVRGVELIVALDVSTSMLTEDVKPSRLQYAKAELNRLFDMIAGDKVGLVGFAGSALLLSPLTTDVSSLKMFLDSLSPYSVENQGTDFSKALQEAHDAFERGGVEDDDRVKTTRVILVLSDGEDQEKGALELAKKYSAEGVKIFTVAFGTERGGLIPIRDERGYLRSYKKDRSGREVMSQVKGEFLKELARVGGGSFHFAAFGGNQAREIKDEIDRLQKAEFASSLATQYEERFQWFLLFALVILGIERLIGEKTGVERVWRGRFETVAIVLVVLSLSPTSARSETAGRISNVSAFKGIRENNRAVESYRSEKPLEAFEGFSQALGTIPDDPTVHFNIGRTFAANKDADKALSEYDVALGLGPDPELEFKLHFNKAWIFAEKKNFDSALQEFQEALRLKPDSKEVKKNIELLISSSGGDGEGDQNQKQDSKDQNDKGKSGPNKDQDQKQDQKDQPKPGPTPKKSPKPFQSEQLSQQDVGKILEEIKRQEDQIRERIQREGAKEAPREKDW